SQILGQNLVTNPRHQLLIFHRENQFHAAVEIARHQVGATQIDFLPAAVAEIENAAVLQEPSHNARDPHCLAHSWNRWPQAANAADQQIDANAGLGGAIEAA